MMTHNQQKTKTHWPHEPMIPNPNTVGLPLPSAPPLPASPPSGANMGALDLNGGGILQWIERLIADSLRRGSSPSYLAVKEEAISVWGEESFQASKEDVMAILAGRWLCPLIRNALCLHCVIAPSSPASATTTHSHSLARAEVLIVAGWVSLLGAAPPRSNTGDSWILVGDSDDEEVVGVSSNFARNSGSVHDSESKRG